MSWYTDPQLFIYSSDSVFRIVKVAKELFDTTITLTHILEEEEKLSFSKHLSLGSNKESDYDAFKASIHRSAGNYSLKFTNCQGLVFQLLYSMVIWSREEPNSPFWRLPGITRQVSDLEATTISSLQDQVNNKQVEKEAIDKRVSDVEAENSILRDEVNNNKAVKEALDKRVLDLEAENSILQDQVSNKQAVKEALDKRVLKLEVKNSILKDQVKRERDEKTVLINVLKREDMHARLQVVEKQIKDLTSKLIQS